MDDEYGMLYHKARFMEQVRQLIDICARAVGRKDQGRTTVWTRSNFFKVELLVGKDVDVALIAEQILERG